MDTEFTVLFGRGQVQLIRLVLLGRRVVAGSTNIANDGGLDAVLQLSSSG
jgi:hypothetical protein